MYKRQKGFTLIEILLVIGIIAVLATVVIVALDPAKRFADARDARRLSDIQSILTAVSQYVIDNKGTLPAGASTFERQIGIGVACDISTAICAATSGTDCLDLSVELVRYLKTLPYDPANGSSTRTHYSLQVDANNIVTVRACDSTDVTISSVSQ
ncbi:MAG: type II secretion system protein [Rectinemataceae bacterium]|nr:type II secretion system protein [Rectinemataceae bacterium]